jgi:hypothetical protein
MVGAQAQINSFQKTFHGSGTSSERANSVQQTLDGGYIFAGVTNGLGAGSYDMYLVKTDAKGDTLWTKTFGGSTYDVANSVIQSADGGFVVTGAANSFTGTVFNDVYLVKTDMNGVTLWTKTYGGTDTDEGYQVQQTTDGGYIIVGTTESYGVKSGDVYLLKTDSGGVLQWTKTFGGTGYDVASSLAQTTDGGYVIAGSSDSFSGGGFDMYLIRTDMNGDTLWTKSYGGSGNDEGISILQNKDGDYVVAGYTTGFGAGNGDMYLSKTDVNGALKWSKTFGGTGYDIAYSIEQISDGGYIIAGTTGSSGAGLNDICLMKTDSDGALLWANALGGVNQEFCFAAHQCTDGGYILSGYTKSFGASGEDAYLVKSNSAGISGCNESNVSLFQSAAATIVHTPFSQVFSGGVTNTPPSKTGRGGIEKVICSVVAIDENSSANGLSVFPNPGNGIFDLESTVYGERFSDVAIYNMMGEKIYFAFNIRSSYLRLNITLQPKGVFFYHVSFENGNTSTGKIINNPQ